MITNNLLVNPPKDATLPAIDYMLWIKRLIWIYFILLMTEGILRKWIVPQLAGPLLVVRDPIVLVIYLMALRQGVFPKDLFTKSIIVLTYVSAIVACYQAMTSSIIFLGVAAFGLHVNFLHLPLVTVIYRVFDREDVLAIGKWILWASIPCAVLMVLQFYSSPTDVINRVAGEGDTLQLTAGSGRIRPPSIFSYITGVAIYYAFVTSYVFNGILNRVKYPPGLLVGAGMAVMAATAVSSSRHVMGMIALVGISLIAIFVVRPNAMNNAHKIVFFAIVLAFSVRFMPFLDDGLQNMVARFGDADVEDVYGRGFLTRITDGFLEPFLVMNRLPMLGLGLGMGTNVGSVLLVGSAEYLLTEGEWGRIVMESGPVLGMVYLVIRTGLTGWMGWVSVRCVAAGNVLPMLLFGAAGYHVITGQFAQSTNLGFAALGAGLCLAASKSREAVVPAEGSSLDEPVGPSLVHPKYRVKK